MKKLIIPALFTRNVANSPLIKAGTLGVAGYAAGLALSAVLDLPSSPMIVWMLAASGIIFSLFPNRS